MSDWVPRGEREGSRERIRFDGVPEHLLQALGRWVEGRRVGEVGCQVIALRLELTVTNLEPWDLLRSATNDEDLVLDVVEGLLWFGHDSGGSTSEGLRQILAHSGSILTVGPDDKTLVASVDPTMERIATEAIAPGDAASQEVAQAWAKAFGRDPDPSDAWDHAIKAVEDALIPVVVPRQGKANLGHVLGALRGQGQQWRSVYPQADKDHNVQGLVAMLEQIWPNPDRHGGGGGKRPPTLAEARAVVVIAAAVVQLARSGDLVSRALPRGGSQ